jgi:hypothetical protein
LDIWKIRKERKNVFYKEIYIRNLIYEPKNIEGKLMDRDEEQMRQGKSVKNYLVFNFQKSSEFQIKNGSVHKITEIKIRGLASNILTPSAKIKHSSYKLNSNSDKIILLANISITNLQNRRS